MDCAEKAKGLEGVILIHSTDLRSGKLGNGLIVNNNNTKLVTGPMILINRVGRPNKEKLICLTEAKTFGLSDCVFALLCPSIKGAIQIWNSIKSNWDLLEIQYGGSGAKYLTIRKYLTYLNNIGYQVKAE
jgi:hypothetical protein